MVAVKTFFESITSTFSYVVYDAQSKDAVIIDPVLNFDLAAGKLAKTSIEEVLSFLNASSLKLCAILETHAHADHLSAAQVVKERFPHVPLCIGENIQIVQKTFSEMLDVEVEQDVFDKLFVEGEEVNFGSITLRVYFTPGHTPACSSYLIGKHLFTGDSLFMPDFGTGRCDFPGGSAETLYHSVTEVLYALPDDTIVHVGHDYGTGGREILSETTIGDSKKNNIHINENSTKEDFLRFRTDRDAELANPRLLFPSLEVNIRGGRLPRQRNGKMFFNWPVSWS